MAAPTGTLYVIQYVANPNFCLGVSGATAGSPVVLSILQGAGSSTTQWYADPSSGYIFSAADTNLCLDFEGTSPSNGDPCIITGVVLGRLFQKWNWVGNPPYIMNIGAPTYAVDNTDGKQTAGNKIQIYTQGSGNKNRQWQFLPVPMLA